jgi:hypothetical protein
MSHLALYKHETQAIQNPPPTFQTVSLVHDQETFWSMDSGAL